eukprot:1150462-Pelagomonas_calceolata.AAC.6
MEADFFRAVQTGQTAAIMYSFKTHFSWRIVLKLEGYPTQRAVHDQTLSICSLVGALDHVRN